MEDGVSEKLHANVILIGFESVNCISENHFCNSYIKIVKYMLIFSGETLTKKSPDVREETETLLRGMDEYLMRNSA